MIKHKRLSALVIMLVAVAGILATTSIALAGWVWCDDPVLNIGGTNLYVKYEANVRGEDVKLSDYFTVTATVGLPDGIDPKSVVSDPQGWSITTYTDDELGAKDVDLTVIVNPISTSIAHRVKISVSLDPYGKNIVGSGHVGETINIPLHIGESQVTVRESRESDDESDHSSDR